MNDLHYTNERQILILISLLKAYGIRKIIASPGATNVTFIGSVQQDDFFEIYSCVDERSAAYMACGLAIECGEPIVLTCTGATSSRNYLPGLTEAYYRKLPILAITSTQLTERVGHLIAQVIDRSTAPNDTTQLSVYLPIIKDENDVWISQLRINQALLALKRHGGGPVHINLETSYSCDFSIKQLPKAHVINRITVHDEFPTFPDGNVAVFVGSAVFQRHPFEKVSFQPLLFQIPDDPARIRSDLPFRFLEMIQFLQDHHGKYNRIIFKAVQRIWRL